MSTIDKLFEEWYRELKAREKYVVSRSDVLTKSLFKEAFTEGYKLGAFMIGHKPCKLNEGSHDV